MSLNELATILVVDDDSSHLTVLQTIIKSWGYDVERTDDGAKAVEKAKGILVVSADHGNSDDMYECDYKTGETIYDEKTGEPKPRTAHSLNPVFAYVYEPTGSIKMELSAFKDPGISSLAATCLTLLGFEPPEDYTPSIVKIN